MSIFVLIAHDQHIGGPRDRCRVLCQVTKLLMYPTKHQSCTLRHVSAFQCDLPLIVWTPGYVTAVLASNSAGDR